MKLVVPVLTVLLLALANGCSEPQVVVVEKEVLKEVPVEVIVEKEVVIEVVVTATAASNPQVSLPTATTKTAATPKQTTTPRPTPTPEPPADLMICGDVNQTFMGLVRLRVCQSQTV